MNDAKWKVITEIEKHMPAEAFGLEWRMLTEAKKGKNYRLISKLEGSIYWVFMAMHIIIPLTMCLNQSQGGMYI